MTKSLPSTHTAICKATGARLDVIVVEGVIYHYQGELRGYDVLPPDNYTIEPDWFMIKLLAFIVFIFLLILIGLDK